MEKRDINKKQLQTERLTSKPNPKPTNQNPPRTIVPPVEPDWKVRTKLRCSPRLGGWKDNVEHTMNNEPQALPCTSVLMILISFQGRTDQSYKVFVAFPLLFGILKAICLLTRNFKS